MLNLVSTCEIARQEEDWTLRVIFRMTIEFRYCDFPRSCDVVQQERIKDFALTGVVVRRD
ncbi:hypothetical protein [Lacunimicrobium album]